MSASPRTTTRSDGAPHAGWVKVAHGIVTLSFLALVLSGVVILMCHPRLYWGEVGNDLTPAWLELPISRNHQHGGWEQRVPFFGDAGSPVSASRTFKIFNENGWGRSLHFLAGWCLVLPGGVYLALGIVTGHFRRHLLPRRGECAPEHFWADLRLHWRRAIPPATGGPQYGLLQKCTYSLVVFVALPFAVITGLAMSPAITAEYPFLSGMLGGHQSARTLHFFIFIVLVLFLLVHVVMVIQSGFKRQMRAMTYGK